MQLRTLTIYQPWASAIVLGLKQFETRQWELKTMGPLAIHAGLADSREFQSVFDQPTVRADFMDAGVKHWTDLPRGAIVGLVQVKKCHPVEQVRDKSSRLELSLGDFRDGRFAIECSRPLIFDNPIPARGHQKIWSWQVPDALEQAVKAWMVRTAESCS